MTGRWMILGAVLAALVQTGIIGWMIADRAQRLQSGTEVQLASQAIDPRDFFRGHYVRLNMAISRIDASTVTVDPDIRRGDTVFLELTTPPDTGFAVPVTIRKTRPETPVGPVIRATAQFNAANKGTRLRVSLPFTRYYAPQARALALENLNREAKLGVILSLSDDGTGVIKGLTIDGRKVYEEPLF